MELFIVRLWDG